MSLRPRPELENLKACPHGGINYAELEAMGLDAGKALDFSVCSNPFMPPPGIKKIINTIAIEQYPDSESTEFRQRVSASLGVATDNIIAGSGTTELIRLIALTYFSRGDTVLIPQPTFGEYETASQIAGAKVVKPWAWVEDSLGPRIPATVDFIRQYRPRAVFICNPNNPTGNYLSRAEVEAVSDAIGDGLLVLDEAYVTFVEQSWPSADLPPRGNIIILRSMTKDYGLAGLRLGYAISRQDIIASLRRVRPPWNVNSVAQKIGAAALEHAGYLERSIEKLGKVRRFLTDELSRLGFPPLPSAANFFLVKVGNARMFRMALLKQGIMVRDCTSFGLPEYVRIAPRTLPQCRKLIATIEELKRRGTGNNTW